MKVTPITDAILPQNWRAQSEESSFDKDEGYSTTKNEFRRENDQIVHASQSFLNNELQSENELRYKMDRAYPEIGLIRLFLVGATAPTPCHLDIAKGVIKHNLEFLGFRYPTPGACYPDAQMQSWILTNGLALVKKLYPKYLAEEGLFDSALEWRPFTDPYGTAYQIASISTGVDSGVVKKELAAKPDGGYQYIDVAENFEIRFRRYGTEESGHQWADFLGIPSYFGLSAVIRGRDVFCETEFCPRAPLEYHETITHWSKSLSPLPENRR